MSVPHQTATSRAGRSAVPVDRSTVPAAMWVGAGLTVLTVLAPLLDLMLTETIPDHVRSAYPQWEASVVATESSAIAGWLAVTGLLGLAGWLLTIRATSQGRRWARAIGTVLALLGLLVACLNLSVGGAAYDVIVPTHFAALTLLPVAAGVVALAQLWRRRPVSSRT